MTTQSRLEAQKHLWDLLPWVQQQRNPRGENRLDFLDLVEEELRFAKRFHLPPYSGVVLAIDLTELLAFQVFGSDGRAYETRPFVPWVARVAFFEATWKKLRWLAVAYDSTDDCVAYDLRHTESPVGDPHEQQRIYLARDLIWQVTDTLKNEGYTIRKRYSQGFLYLPL